MTNLSAAPLPVHRPRVNRLPLAAGDRSIARPRVNTVIKPVHGTARLFLQINETLYSLKRLRPDPAVASAAWQLRKADGTVYHVCRRPHGPECDCKDFLFNRAHVEGGCKHCRALVASSLL